MSTVIPFDQIARLPSETDNVAIAIHRLEAGTEVNFAESTFVLPHTILEGHRLAVRPIVRAGPLLSWGLPFGFATGDIAPGDYVCNEAILTALKQRRVSFQLPAFANFRDHYVRFQLDEGTVRPAAQVQRYPEPTYFDGYARVGGRGVGTRNFIVVLGTTSRTASYARSLAERFKNMPQQYRNIDGIVPVAHTEGGGLSRPNNLEIVLRTLAGFLVHPNVGAVLAVDFGTEPITNSMLQSYLAEHNYPIESVLHQFLTLRGTYQAGLQEGEAILNQWLETANSFPRSKQSVEHLNIGLQCGGSDAFSGVSGNPLVGWVAKKLIRYGGMANLAETDELIGAESYVLSKVRDLETARAFLAKIDRFQERAGWHGQGAFGNPSGGNMFRGLYNIAIKSIGAARKKDPELRLDYAIDYADLMRQPGFYFMDSPGNDLESIAGQVGSGCNLILFTTGNGSITNFPFVPTIKIMTNTGRFNMLSREMDINAGRYLDGTPMDQLGRETFDYMLGIASGQRSAGEKAGHSQVQLWREWRQTDRSQLATLLSASAPSGEPIPVTSKTHTVSKADRRYQFAAIKTDLGYACDRVGLILPTSLCSSQISQAIAARLNSLSRNPSGEADMAPRYVALPHTEGCGVSSGPSEELYLRTMTGYLRHPSVQYALLLEHGCEKTHNDAMHNYLESANINPSRYGFASIQLDGGIDAVTDRVVKWFQNSFSNGNPPTIEEVGLDQLRLAFVSSGPLPSSLASALATMKAEIVNAGGSMVLPQNSHLLSAPLFKRDLLSDIDIGPTLAYGQSIQKPGLHVMENPTDHHVETLTGLAATGVEIVLTHVTGVPLQSHPLVPLVQVSTDPNTNQTCSQDLDLFLNPSTNPPAEWAHQLLELVLRVASRQYIPKVFVQGNTDFQITRGLLGVSL